MGSVRSSTNTCVMKNKLLLNTDKKNLKTENNASTEISTKNLKIKKETKKKSYNKENSNPIKLILHQSYHIQHNRFKSNEKKLNASSSGVIF